MKKSIKAALLSGVLGAGAGHLFLKRYRRGAILIFSTLSCLVIIATQAIKQTQVIFDKLPSPNEAPGFDELSVLLTENLNKEDFVLTNVVTMLIMLIWTLAVFDAYKIGKDMEKEKEQEMENGQ